MSKRDAELVLKVQALVREYARTHPDIIVPCEKHNRLPCLECNVGLTDDWLAWQEREAGGN